MGSGVSTAHEIPEAEHKKQEAYFMTKTSRIRHLMKNADLNIQALVEHYQPPSFPIEPLVTTKTVEICKHSYNLIKTQERKGVSGVVYFYDEFYKRLFDRSEAFNGFFSGDMKKKGAVLIRIVEFITTIDMDAVDIFYKKVEGLAKVHSKRTIRPWMYSVFMETLMTTISFCLEEKATYEVSSAWTHLAAFVLRCMLPGAIKDGIVTTESNQNAFSGDLDEDQILDLEEQRSEGGDDVYTGRSTGRKSGRNTNRTARSAKASARGIAPAADGTTDGAPQSSRPNPVV